MARQAAARGHEMVRGRGGGWGSPRGAVRREASAQRALEGAPDVQGEVGLRGADLPVGQDPGSSADTCSVRCLHGGFQEGLADPLQLGVPVRVCWAPQGRWWREGVPPARDARSGRGSQTPCARGKTLSRLHPQGLPGGEGQCLFWQGWAQKRVRTLTLRSRPCKGPALAEPPGFSPAPGRPR